MSLLQSLGSPSEDYDDDAQSTSAEEASKSSQHNATEQSSPVVEVEMTTPLHPPKVLGQKRRRVTRACDECRRKKIKCDGKQPCTHCTVYSYDCTYDQPSNRRRNPAPQYIEALESRLHRAEIILKQVLPDVDLDDPKLDTGVPQRMHPAVSQIQSPVAVPTSSGLQSVNPEQTREVEADSLLESMVENTASLDLDDQGFYDFHGHSSGIVFLRRMREQFGDLMGKSEGYGLPFLQARNLHEAFESPKSHIESPTEPNLPSTHDLPTKDCALSLCGYALDDACSVMRFVHQPTFYVMLDRVYDAQPEHFGNEENRFLPLLYMTMALGCLFTRAEGSELQINGYQSAIDQGFQWFRASRQLMEITDCRDLTSLQTVLLMIMFLQSSAKLSTCYSHIGIALRSAIRMGLHRVVAVDFNPVERETRKRIFWVIRMMDTYVGALLGLPKLLSDEDIDQELPIEVDDEFITTQRVLPMPPGRVSVMAAFNAHARLCKIMAKTVKNIYPVKASAHMHSKHSRSYLVSHAKIREIEQELQEWNEKLPIALRPGGQAPPELARIQQLLRVAYSHVQVFLYRPFLHYVSQNLQSETIDDRSYACAAACVSVSQNIIHCTGEMKKRGLLIGAYWFYMYTTFFAIISLVFFVLENPQHSTSNDILQDALKGNDTLAGLAKRSMAADRCTITLAGLFKQLPERLKGVAANAPPLNKRHATSQHHLSKVRSTCSEPERLSTPVLPKVGVSQSKHSSTSPRSHIRARKHASLPHDSLTSRREPFVGIEPEWCHFSHLDHTGLQTPESAIGQAHSSLPNTFPSRSPTLASNSFPDFSSMMFPSADPFAYPNQPMTTLENRNLIKSEEGFDVNMYDLSSTPMMGGTYNNNPNAQIYGPLPPYLMQGQPGATVRDPSTPLQTYYTVNDPNLMAMSNGNGGWFQHRASNGETQAEESNQEFGDWNNGWMNQGYSR